MLLWRWSARPTTLAQTFQIASGAYLAVFILGHMNSVFVYARTYLGIATDWGFATGAPNGLLRDGWNVRLIPHYWLGVFFMLAHVASGLRVVLLAHDVRTRAVNAWFVVGVVGAAIIATAILLAMTGFRLD